LHRNLENNVGANYEAELNRIVAVQECDATMLSRYSVAGYIKIKKKNRILRIIRRNFKSFTK